MDFKVDAVSSQSEIQVIKWELTLPDDVRKMGVSEGIMRIYTTQKDFVGLAPLVMVCSSLNKWNIFHLHEKRKESNPETLK